MDRRDVRSEGLQKHESGTPERVQQRPSVAPRVDIYENDNEVLLIADLPGVTSETLRINLDNEQLTIEGNRHEEPLGSLLGREFQDMDYHRAFLVPQGIDAGKIGAELKQGVLYLHLPKSEAVKPRQISVKAG